MHESDIYGPQNREIGLILVFTAENKSQNINFPLNSAHYLKVYHYF